MPRGIKGSGPTAGKNKKYTRRQANGKMSKPPEEVLVVEATMEATPIRTRLWALKRQLEAMTKEVGAIHDAL